MCCLRTQVPTHHERLTLSFLSCQDEQQIDFKTRVQNAAEDDEALRVARVERKKAKKEEKKEQSNDPGADDFGGMDPEMAAMMGFGGFGGGKN